MVRIDLIFLMIPVADMSERNSGDSSRAPEIPDEDGEEASHGYFSTTFHFYNLPSRRQRYRTSESTVCPITSDNQSERRSTNGENTANSFFTFLILGTGAGSVISVN